MLPKKVTQTKNSVSDEVFSDEDGKSHLIECSGPGQDGNGCVAWVPVWLPTRLPKNFTERPFLCGYCAFTEVEKLRKEAHGDSKVQEIGSQICFYRMPMNNTDDEKMSEYLMWKSKQERMCISRLWMWWKEQVLKFVSDISVCYRLPARGQSGKPIFVKFVRRETKLALMKKKSGLRHQSGRPIYIIDDITQLRVRVLKSLKEKPDVKAANMINEKIIVYQTNNDKIVFHTLQELYKWDPGLVMRVWADKLNFQ